MSDHDQTHDQAADRKRENSLRSELAIQWLFPISKAQVTRFARLPLVLGRGQDCDVRLSESGTGTSRRHATIQRRGQQLVISDNSSTNGTFVNGCRVNEAPLVDGDIVRVGDWVGLVDWIAADSAEGPVFGELGGGLWGGARFERAIADALLAAPSRLPIVIYGKTGSGKEGVARAVHERSGRRGPLLAVNCGAIPDELLEATLFGHLKGAFTGAAQASAGHFRSAHGGTLFLDEIAELSARAQAVLLRALQEGEVTPVGGSRAVRVDVRIVAACQAPLSSAVGRGLFREDLYMRLAGVELTLPSLEQRVQDVPRLFSIFVRQAAKDASPELEPALIEALCLRAWPGNVRQLQMLAQRLVALDNGRGLLRRQDLPPVSEHPPSALPNGAFPNGGAGRELRPLSVPAQSMGLGDKGLSANTAGRLRSVLLETNGNVSEAARVLGVSRQHAYRLLRAAGLRPDVVRSGSPDSVPPDSGEMIPDGRSIQ